MFNLSRIFFAVLFLWFYFSGEAFFEIVEVMPNTLDDKNLEYIIIKNTSSQSQSLSWYTLADKKKQYIFSEDIFFNSWERQKFFRPETKIILNNSDEEIYLYKPDGELIDEVSYTKSTKWEFLTFEEIDNWWEENIISREVYISWEIFISDEAIIDVEEKIALEVPEIIFSLQRPSYISQSGFTDIYICDDTRDECKVNFDLRDSFSGTFPEKNYKCDINFGIWELTGQEWRCNPNTVTFPKGEFQVEIKIWHEDDIHVFKENNFFIKNIILQPLSLEKREDSGESLGLGEEIGKEEIIERKIHIRRPGIIIQSWITWKWKYFYCEKTDCKMNLDYKKRHSDERCFWNFAHNEQSSRSTHKRCNPGYVTIPEGIHEMSLIVYEKGNENNKKRLRFYVYNEEISVLSISTPIEKELKQEPIVWEAGVIKIKINLQWKLPKEKTLSGSILTCNSVEKCYVNLEWVISLELPPWNKEFNSGLGKLKYIWKLNNAVFSEKLNPNWIWIEWIWVHEITLSSWSLEERFYVNIIKSTPPKIWVENTGLKEIDWINIIGEKEIINFTQNFLTLKYDGLRISWKAPVWSTIEIYNAWEKILKWSTDEKWKYRLVSKYFIAWEYIFDTKIILDSGEEKFIENSGSFILQQQKRVYWFIPSKTKRTSTKKTKMIKAPSLIVQTEFFDDLTTDKQKLSIVTKVFLIFMISLCAIFGALHLIISQIPPIIENSCNIYKIRYWVKSQVLLCL
jgi:hypothetical protein